MMKNFQMMLITLCLCAICGTARAQYDVKVIRDVVEVVAATSRHDRAWEWDGECVPEVANIAKHGQIIAPLLVELLNHPTGVKGEDWPIDTYICVDQQFQLALCRIFGEQPVLGVTVYGVRVLEKDNLKVKAFWRQKIQSMQEKSKEVQPATPPYSEPAARSPQG